MTAAGQFDASGKIFILNTQPPDDLTGIGGGVFNFVEDQASYYESVSSHGFEVASAAALTLPGGADFFNVTGTTTITSIATSWDGRVVTLKFAGALTVTDGSNLKLAGSYTTVADDTLTLVHRSGVWYEVGRNIDFSKRIKGGSATTSAGFGAWLTAKALSTGTEAAYFQRFSSGQTADIMAVADESGNVYCGFDKNGYFHVRKTSAPADGDIEANEVFFWFDPTNGAAKVKFKGKQADGTVRSGEVALT